MKRRNMENIGRTLSRSLGTAILLFLLWGCSLFYGPLTMDQVTLFEKGMSSESLSAMVEREPGEVIKFVDPQDDSKYQLEIFPMETGETYPFYVWNKYGGSWGTAAVTDDYLFLFHDDSLIFWGFLYQYPRSYDDPLGRLYPIIQEHLE